MHQNPNFSRENIWSEFNKPPQANINFSAQIDGINVQQLNLRSKILESEKNLTAQHQVWSINRSSSELLILSGSPKICIFLQSRRLAKKNIICLFAFSLWKQIRCCEHKKGFVATTKVANRGGHCGGSGWQHQPMRAGKSDSVERARRYPHANHRELHERLDQQR